MESGLAGNAGSGVCAVLAASRAVTQYLGSGARNKGACKLCCSAVILVEVVAAVALQALYSRCIASEAVS
jgi:hypothetical protein